ncbi:MAG TPA: protein kinase [Myxococcaceae bacterium]|nr:protein kinase [Myxococcaceae bacterium]
MTTTPQPRMEPGGSAASLVRPYGQYVLVRKLAEGGMAEIFLAKRLGADGFERNVVIKRMLPHLTSLPDFVEMFRDEARLAAKLHHPNIVRIEDLGLAEGYYYICMEYLPGEDFSTTVRTASYRREYVPVPLVLRVIAEAARGLHHAHESTDESGRPLHIVHRDVSPSNLYVTYEGQVKVLDFGIAKAETRLAHTRTGVVKGKYMYMAPEQAGGGELDRRADVFSLGVSLYEALTHVRPFARDNDLAVLKALLEGEFQPPRALRPDLSPELEAVVLKAMAYEPAKRYPTAAALAEDLERLLAKEPQPPNGAALAAYLRASFGEERYAERTRIPTLSSLLPAGTSLPAPSFVGQPHATPITEPEARTGVVPPPPGTGASVAAGRRRGLLVGLLAGVLLVSGAAFVVGRSVATPAPAAAGVEPTVSPGAVAPSAAAAQEAPTQEPPAPSQEPPTALAPEAAVAQAAPEPAEPPAETRKAPTRTTRTRRVTLEASDIQRVVSRGRARIMSCFEQHKASLPSDEGEVRVRFTIYSSGKVKADTQGPLARTAVGQCLERQVERLRFPAHKDQEVTVVLPFGYRVTR